MSYKLTPEQYKDAAMRRINNKNTAENTNSAVSAYARGLNGNRALDNKNVRNTEVPATENIDDDQASDSWLVRSLSTVAAVPTRLIEGLAKFLENATLDLGAGLAASVMDIFGADEAAKDVQAWAAQDLIGELFDWEPIQDIYNNSLSNEWGNFGKILQEGIYSVGQQAVPFALNLLTGGTAGTALSMGAFAMGAYGSGFESASQDGGSVLGSSAYGLLSAGLEFAVENIGGAFGWGKTLTGELDDVIYRVSKNESVQRLLKGVVDAVGEGAEEVVSGMLNNYVKAMTYNGDYASVKSYFNNILSAEPATQEELMEQFIVGAVAGGLMGGVTNIVRAKNPTMQMTETMQELEDLKEKGYQLNQRGKDTAETETRIAEKENALLDKVNANFDRLTKDRGKKNGTANAILSYMENNFNTDENGHFTTTKNVRVKSINASYDVTENDVQRAVLDENNTLHEGEFEGKALESKQSFLNALNRLNANLGENRLKYVIADLKNDDNGYIKDNIIVINSVVLGEQRTITVNHADGKQKSYTVDGGMSVLLHEVLHFTDDTKAGVELQELLFKYGVARNTDLANNVAATYNDMNAKTQISEISATQLEQLLFNETIINRLTEDNSTLVKRILNKVKHLWDTLRGHKLAETKELEHLLKETIKLYNKAIAQKGKGETIRVQALDNDEEIRYSRRTNKFRYQPRDFSQITELEYNHHAWAMVNGILTQNESGSFIKKIGEKKNGTGFAQTADGLYMIPVGENGIENKIVYTDGDWESPSIAMLVEINSLSDETLLDEARRYLYDSERRGIQRKASQLFRFHYAEDYGYAEWSKNIGIVQKNSAQRSGERNGNGADSEIRRSRRILTNEEIRSSIDDTVQMLTTLGNVDETLDVSVNKTALLKKYAAKINELAAKGRLTENSKAVKELVDAIFDGVIITEAYDDTVIEKTGTLNLLREYLHKINLSTDSIKPDIQHKYGKTNDIFKLWGKKDGGIAWDKAVQEIVERMPDLAVDGEGDSGIATLFNIFDTYKKTIDELKRVRTQASDLIANADEAKRLMAKQLVLSISELGTELVTSELANKLQSIITEKRTAIRETLRAIKAGKTDVLLSGELVSEQTKQQLQDVVKTVAEIQAKSYAKQQAEAVVAHFKKNITKSEIRELQKLKEFQALEDYIKQQRLETGKAVTIEFIKENQPALILDVQRVVSAVRSIRTKQSNNHTILVDMRDLNTDTLKQRLNELSVDDMYLNAFAQLKSDIQALFKKSSDNKHILLSYDEMLENGALKKVVASFENYCKEGNPALEDIQNSGMFPEVQNQIKTFKEYLDALREMKYSEMSLAEKQTFNDALTNFLSQVSRIMKPNTNIRVKGETVQATTYRDKALRGIKANAQRGKNGEYRAEKRSIAAFADKHFRDWLRPYEAIAMAENHCGYLKALFDEVREGAITGENVRADLEDIVFNFINDKKNRIGKQKYADYLLKQEITIEHSSGEFVLNKGELIGLYLTLMQEDGFRHADASNPLAKGIYFDSKDTSTNYRNKQALKFTAENVAALEKHLNETDVRFIETLRGFFTEAGKLKGEIDKQLYGIERLLGDDYYPLQIDKSDQDANIGNKVSFYDALDPTGHLSINQSRSSGLKSLRVRNVADVVVSYAKSVGLYYGVAVPIANMRLVYGSKGVEGDSIRDFIAKTSTKEFDGYLDKLLLDVQGAIKVTDSFLERQRQRYAAFAIAANIKSPIKALSGLFSLVGKLKTTSFLKGMISSPFSLIKSGKADFTEMYKYCPATRIRYRDKQATLAAMNVEGGEKAKTWLVDKLAIGIELVDKYTVYVAWNGCKEQVGAVGVNANNPELLEKAGKLLNECLDTIDRFEMTERNGLSRSEDSLHRGLAMFSSSSQAQLTQIVETTFTLSQQNYMKKHLPELIQEAETYRKSLEEELKKAEERLEKAKAAGDNKAERSANLEIRKIRAKINNETLLISELNERQASIDNDIKKSSLATQKTIISVSMAIVTSAALSQLMSNLMGDEEDEEWGENFAYGMIDEGLSGVLAMLPGIGQFYNALEFKIGNFEKKSYDMSFWALDEWNAIADSFNSIVGLLDGTGTATPAKVARDFTYAIGQWFGIPTRNLFNAINAVLKNIPTVDYQWDALFSKGNYGSDLKKAIDAKDTELAETIVKLMMKDTFGTEDTKVTKTVRSLYEQGYASVLPKTVSSSITINGVSHTLTTSQQKRFKAIYSKADSTITKLVGKQSFANLSAKVQADSIKWIYDYYYQKAKEDLSGIEDDSKKATFARYIPVETLAVAYSTANSLESDKDKQGNVLLGTKKAKVVKYLNGIRATAAEKYMMLGYLGYSPVNSNAAALITAFARKNGASQKEIKELLAMCNIAV